MDNKRFLVKTDVGIFNKRSRTQFHSTKINDDKS